MSVPRHEKQSDLDAQEEIIAAWCGKYRMRYEFMYHAGRYKFDYGIYNNDWKLKAVAEVKDRSKKFDTVILDLSKALSLMEYHEIGYKSFFVVRFPDGIYSYRFTALSWQRITQARMHHSKYRQDDRGPVVDLPITSFEKL